MRGRPSFHTTRSHFRTTVALFIVAIFTLAEIVGGLLILSESANAAGITRIQSATGSNGGATTITATLGSAPTNGNALVAVVGTRGTSANRVTGITQTGVTWVKAIGAANASGTTTDIWYALNVSGAATSLTVNLAASLKASVVIAEYSNIAGASAVDQTATNVSAAASNAPSTGTSPTTTVANELWIGGIDQITSANSQTFSNPTNGFVIVAQTGSTGGSAGTRERSGLLEKIVSSTGTASTGATFSAATNWSGAIVTFKPSPALGMSAYRLYANQNSTDVGNPLGPQDSGATLSATGQSFRLRMLLGVTLADLPLSGQDLKLQFRAAGGACNATGTWTDITGSTSIAYADNATPTDNTVLTANTNDPTIASATIQNQTYEELNNFTNSQTAIAVGAYGKWDFSLRDNGAAADTSYCIRAATLSGTALSGDTVYPSITTKGPDAVRKQEQFDATRALLAVGASTTDGVSTPLYFDQYMRSASPSDILTPNIEIRNTATAFSNAATQTGDPIAYDPEVPKDARSSCSVYDSANQQMVTWGGYSGDSTKANTNDAWALSLKAKQRSQWKLLTTSGTKPQANRAHVCVYDSVNARLVVFGGWDGATYLTTVWTLTLPTDGSTPAWSQLTTSGTPTNSGQLLQAAAVYQSNPSRMIVFGGFSGATDFANVTQLTLPTTGTPTWSDLALAGPSARDAHSMLYDAANNRAVMFGGGQGNTFYNDVWSLNLTSGSEAWTQLFPTGTAPSVRGGHFAAWQPDYDAGLNDRMVIFAGTASAYLADVWELQFPAAGGAPVWTDRTPGGSTGTQMPDLRAFGASPGVYDPLNKRALFPFGYRSSTVYDNEIVAFDLTTVNASLAFYNLNDVRGLRARDGTMMAYDPNGKEMVIYGGAGRGEGPAYAYHLGETWKMGVQTVPPAWTDAGSDLSPFKREFGVLEYDTTNSRMVYCLGLSSVVYPADCWQLVNPASGKATWSQLATSGSLPSGRMVPSGIYDSANSRLVIFGGKNSVATNELNFLSLPSGGSMPSWSIPTVSGTAPSVRWGAHTIYDPVRDRMLVFGGANFAESAYYNDLYELTLPTSGTPTWRTMAPAGTPPVARRGGVVVYDPDRGDGIPRLILFSGVGGTGSTHYSDVWELTIPSSGDGTWTQLSPSGTVPSVRRSAGAAYDPLSDRMIVYGGRDVSSFYNETFSLTLGTSPAWSNLSPTYYVPGTVKVDGLPNNTGYHWQGWASGSVSGVSPTFAYGSNVETAADFTIGTVGGPPAVPSSLTQNKVTGGAVISTGGWTNEGQIRLSGSATDPDASDTLQLCVEKQPIGTAFTGVGEVCGAGIAYSGTAVTVSVDLTGLGEGEYHWQARVKDAVGGYSSTGTTWTSYGGNLETARDFGVDTSTPTGTVYDGITTGVDQSFNDGSLSSLSANWNINSTISGIAGYEYSVGTTSGGTDIRAWTSAGTSTSVTASSLSLITSKIYYFNVRTTDNAGNMSTISGNGVMVAPTLTFGMSSNTINFARPSAGNSYTVSQTVDLTATTNAQNGYQVYAKATDLLRNQSTQTLGMFNGGTYALPGAWLSSNTGFGYNSSDTSVGGINRFNSATCPNGGSAPCFAPYSMTGIGDVIADNSGPPAGGPALNDTVTITNKASIDSATQQSGIYRTTILYSAYATY